MAPSAVAVVVVTNTHLASLRVQDIGTMAFGVHPCVDDLFRRDAAPCGILAGGGIGDAIVLQDGEALRAIGTWEFTTEISSARVCAAAVSASSPISRAVRPYFARWALTRFRTS